MPTGKSMAVSGLRIGKTAGRVISQVGAKIATLAYVDFGAIPAAIAKGLMNDATSTQLPNNSTITYTADTDGTAPLNASTRYGTKTLYIDGQAGLKVYDLVVARNVVVTVTHGSSVVAMSGVISGYDELTGEDGGTELVPMTEAWSVSASGQSKTYTGAKAFKYVRSISLTSAGNATTNTVAITVGVACGLPVAAKTKNSIVSVRIDGKEDTGANLAIVPADVTDPATSSTGDVRGTVTFHSTPNGTLTMGVLIAADATNFVTLYGVKQA